MENKIRRKRNLRPELFLESRSVTNAVDLKTRPTRCTHVIDVNTIDKNRQDHERAFFKFING